MNEKHFRYKEHLTASDSLGGPARRGQSRRGSFSESLMNVAIGYGIAISAQEIIFPLFGIHIPLHDNLTIGAIFTVISIVRSYTLRRAFNWWHCRGKIKPLACASAVIPPDAFQKRKMKLEGKPVSTGHVVGRPAIHKASAAGEWRDGVFVKGKS